jgi:hypothetical protein
LTHRSLKPPGFNLDEPSLSSENPVSKFAFSQIFNSYRYTAYATQQPSMGMGMGGMQGMGMGGMGGMQGGMMAGMMAQGGMGGMGGMVGAGLYKSNPVVSHE